MSENRFHAFRLQRRMALGILVLSTAVLGGCAAIGGQNAPAITQYQLPPKPAPVYENHTKLLCPSLRVAEPIADRGYGGTSIHYSNSPYVIESYAYHQWATAPASMLQPILIETLSDAKLFRTVLGPDAPATSSLQLNTRLIELDQRIEGKRSEIHLVIRNSLSNMIQQRQIAAQRFSVIVPSQPDPASGVIATDTAIGRWSLQLTRWLRQEMRASGLCKTKAP